MTAPCAGVNPFHVTVMLPLCAGCDRTDECRQLAAEAPFKMLEPQVWGGLVLPRDNHLLPPTRQQAQYPPERVHDITPTNKLGAGRPPWWHGLGRNYEGEINVSRLR